MEMLRQSEGTLMKVCLCFTDRSPDGIRDLYQSIVCALWSSWPSFRGDSRRNTWVMRIALNVAGMELRRRSREPETVEMDERFYAALADEATDARYQRLYWLIDQLDDADERRLLLLYLDRYKLKDIASMTGCTEAAVKQSIYRIKQKLRTLKQQYDE